ncbi:helix-turn-helix domain-containing protein [Jiella sp. MQZ9-1]|uniref:Helix-turn-helix domain-containing protein n=1 Tax=Jiella flava TaxID=2816857 RepID=A0A939FVM5_9HYPH|nr:helix-turn-helix domain-containing protein [Jiella flava]MBO0661689.1 helix-turn-helix domain-containing protein [Jiella flava]MCD2470331.1 helix-turn-helix domain-containing protein [Jiella flava]
MAHDVTSVAAPTSTSAGFDVSRLSGEEKFDIWRNVVRPLFDVRPAGGDPATFDGGANALHAGTVLLSRAKATAQSFHREVRKNTTPEWDHIVIQLYEQGGYVGDCAGTPIDLRPGEISVLDLARPLSTVASNFSNITLLIPREFGARLQGAIYHGRRLGNGERLTPLARSHMSFLADNAGQLTNAEMEAGVEALLALMSARSFRDANAHVKAAMAASLRQRIVHFIDEHLADSDLSPAAIAYACGMSRASLYRLADVDGGLSTLVQARRLAKAYDMITDISARAIRIDDVAYAVGFVSAAHFSRAFKARYLIAPRELRSLSMNGFDRTLLKHDRRLYDWTLQMRRQYARYVDDSN